MPGSRYSPVEVVVAARPKQTPIGTWLYTELRRAILDGRLKPGSRLPASRQFAEQFGVSRGTAVTVFEQLQSEGYLLSQMGSGTWVNDSLPAGWAPRSSSPKAYKRPPALDGLPTGGPPRPFRLSEPIEDFPIQTWARVAGRRLRKLKPSMLVGLDVRGCRPLREAVAGYLGTSRGVNCTPDQVAIVSGVQQGLDVLARLLSPGDAVWLEDPGYFGTAMVFKGSAARIVPVPVDRGGISVECGRRLCPRPKLVYVTPGHQFPLGVTMSFDRRMQLLEFARESGALVIEDDYDSEFRFEREPLGALQGLDRSGSVVFTGSFNKLLFPALRIGYVVLPQALIEPFLSVRLGMDLHSSAMDQMILCDFISEGHLSRHLRRSREIHAERLGTLLDASDRLLKGALDVSRTLAGLYTVGLLTNGLTSQRAEQLASARQVETMGLHRCTLGSTDVHGLVLGFAGYSPDNIAQSVEQLAAALGSVKGETMREARDRRYGS